MECRNQDRLHTNDDIDRLLTDRMPLIQRTAAAICAHRAPELSHEVVSLWFDRFLSNAAWWDQLAIDAYAPRMLRRLAVLVVARWRREELDEPGEEGQWPEWGAANTRKRYEGGVGEAAAGNHVASNDEVRSLFGHVAARAYEGMAVDALDLWAIFEDAPQDVRRAIRELASGHSRAEVGEGEYRAARKCLQMALA
jgi:hypothetical protein